MPRCFLYFFLFFLNVAKTKSSFFFLCILLLCSICVWVFFFFFFLNLKGIALYVYKLNEDKILFCINVHLRTIRAVATWC